MNFIGHIQDKMMCVQGEFSNVKSKLDKEMMFILYPQLGILNNSVIYSLNINYEHAT